MARVAGLPSSRHTAGRLVRVVAAVALAAPLVAVSVTSAFAASGRTTLPGSAPAWANSAHFAGAADPSQDVGFRVYLGWNNASGVEALAKAVSTPGNASYGKFLTPAQFRQQFAPSQAQVNAVQTWLKSQGFSTVYTPQNNHYVAAEGTVAQASAAFGVSFGMYNEMGLTLRSPSGDVAISASSRSWPGWAGRRA